jgi:hypothetical protein
MPPPEHHLQATGAAVVVGASRLLPLPLVDDWIASLSRRQLAKAILRRHGRRFAVSDVGAVYNDGSLLGLPWRMVKSLLLFPVKKILKPLLPFLLVRDLGLAVGRTLAFAHTLDRQLRLGLLRDDDDKATRKDQARRLRQALDTAWRGIDQRLVRRAVAGVVQKARRQEPSAELEGFLAELDRRVDQALAGIDAG